MAIAPEDPERHRRTLRRRAVVGWAVGILVVLAIVAQAVLSGGGGHHTDRPSVPYGETMTSSQYDALETGESEADVLRSLDATGRPERLTKEYVLVLFPPREGDAECTFWEFSDQPEIFARLCFSDSELVDKQENDVHRGLEELENAVTT